MRARTGKDLKPRAFCVSGFAALALLLCAMAEPAAAQYDEPADEVIEEGVADPVADPLPPPTLLPAGDAAAWANTASLYVQPPDVGHCAPGVLRAETKAGFLAAFNALRARHGLAPIRYNAAADSATAEAAMMMAANDALSHDPPPSWTCWTAAGAAAAGSSNLLGGVSSPYLAYEDDNAVLAEWLIEGDSDAIGHRRWMLDPYLRETTVGRVITTRPGGVRLDSVVMKVFDFAGDSVRRGGPMPTVPAFVAWPQGNYPRIFFSPRAHVVLGKPGSGRH